MVNIESGEKRSETENKRNGRRSSETATVTVTVTILGQEVTVMTDLGGIMNEEADEV